MRLSGILASLIGLGEAQDIITDQPADEGIIFNQAGETHQISYLDREFNEDDVNVQCTSQSMCIKMSKQFLIDEDITTKFEGVHLKNCTQGVRNEDDQYIELCTDLGYNTCGTEMHMNSTHVSYLNRLFTTNREGDTIERGSVVLSSINEFIVPWHCVYPLDYLVGLSSDTGNDYGYFIPQIYDVVKVTLLMQPGEGRGDFPVTMMLYTDSTYQEVYNEPPTLNVTDRLYVQTQLLKGPEDSVIQTKECWATASADIEDVTRFQLIQDYCVDGEAGNRAEVDLITNGISRTSRWESNVFKFVDEPNVHLHCRVRICFTTDGNTCDQFDCASRRKRREAGLPEEEDAIVSIGPLKLGNKVLLVDGKAIDVEDIELFEELEIIETTTSIPKYFIYIVVGCLVVVVSLISAIMILVYKKKKANAKARLYEGQSNSAFST